MKIAKITQKAVYKNLHVIKKIVYREDNLSIKKVIKRKNLKKI